MVLKKSSQVRGDPLTRGVGWHLIGLIIAFAGKDVLGLEQLVEQTPRTGATKILLLLGEFAEVALNLLDAGVPRSDVDVASVVIGILRVQPRLCRSAHADLVAEQAAYLLGRFNDMIGIRFALDERATPVRRPSSNPGAVFAATIHLDDYPVVRRLSGQLDRMGGHRFTCSPAERQGHTRNRSHGGTFMDPLQP